MKRALSPSLNPTGLGAAIAAVYAAVVMILHAAHHQGVIDPQVIVGGAAAIWLLYTRFVVTPVKDPKDGDGHPLVHAWGSSRAPGPAEPSNVTVLPPLSAAAEQVQPPGPQP